LTPPQDGALGEIMRVHDLITRKLTEAFRPETLRVVDESHQHEGHAGHRPGGESHFRVYIVSQAFAGKSRVERHRLVNAALAAELAERVHALAIHASAPGETAG
jgi:BolA protein